MIILAITFKTYMMELTGKCKEAFTKWHMDKYIKTFSVNYVEMVNDKFGGFIYGKLQAFHCSPEEMKYGVYVDFLDSVGATIEVWAEFAGDEDYEARPVDFYGVLVNDEAMSPHQVFQTRHEARTAAITRANEFFNNN